MFYCSVYHGLIHYLPSVLQSGKCDVGKNRIEGKLTSHGFILERRNEEGGRGKVGERKGRREGREEGGRGGRRKEEREERGKEGEREGRREGREEGMERRM